MNSPVPSTSFASPKGSLFTKREPLRVIQTCDISKRVQRTYKKFKEKPLPPPFKTRIDGPSATWKVFNRLQMATDYADNYAKDCMVFSFEDKVGNEGHRLFLVAHPEQMWQKHRARELEERCSYEIIRENHPSRLYFDLEFYTTFNREKNGNDMTHIFIQCVIASMFEQHNLLLKKTNFLWLDASNEQKFSSHLILQMKDVAFKNNIEAGIFVSILTSTMRKRMESNTPTEDLWPPADQIKTLLVKSKKEKEVFFCDEGVYSKNRNFRMFLSTKHGKKSPLLLSEYNEYVPSTKCIDGGSVFYDSLITYFRDTKVIKLLNYDEKTPSNVYSQGPLSKRMRTNKQDVSGTTSSPFSDVDSFVHTIIKDNFAIGFIRKWTYFCNEQKIVYDIGNYRYCSNIGRHHKSNNIKIVVDMKSQCFYQTCLDPDCRKEGYRSDAKPLPCDVVFLNVPDDFFDSDCFSQLQANESKSNCCNESSTDGLEKMFDSENSCQDWFLDIKEDFTQPNKTTSSEISTPTPYQLNQASWDAFFVENFGDESKENQDVNETSISDSLLGDTLNFTLECSEDNLDSVPLEEELLMVKAVEATETAVNGNGISKEIAF